MKKNKKWYIATGAGLGMILGYAIWNAGTGLVLGAAIGFLIFVSRNGENKSSSH